jgi:hypothetical protein
MYDSHCNFIYMCVCVCAVWMSGVLDYVRHRTSYFWGPFTISSAAFDIILSGIERIDLSHSEAGTR